MPGRSPGAAAAMAMLDRTMFLWGRRMMKGELLAKLIAALDLGLDVGQVQALTAVTRIRDGIGRPAGEPATVGLLAEELSLDPSRASRVAADLVQRGYLRREAAQEDGRRTVLTPTPAAQEALRRLRDAKAARLQALFADWTDEEVETFARLFGRYVEGVLGDAPA